MPPSSGALGTSSSLQRATAAAWAGWNPRRGHALTGGARHTRARARNRYGTPPPAPASMQGVKGLLVTAVSTLVRFPPLFEVARRKARETIKDRALAIGVDFDEAMRELGAQDWDTRVREATDPAVASPAYYTLPFHAYPQVLAQGVVAQPRRCTHRVERRSRGWGGARTRTRRATCAWTRRWSLTWRRTACTRPSCRRTTRRWTPSECAP